VCESGITISSQRVPDSSDAFEVEGIQRAGPQICFGRLTLAGSPITTMVIILPFPSLPSVSSLLLQLIIMKND